MSAPAWFINSLMGPERKSKEDVAVSDLTITSYRKISQGRYRCSRCYDLGFVVTSRGLIWMLPMLRQGSWRKVVRPKKLPDNAMCCLP